MSRLNWSVCLRASLGIAIEGARPCKLSKDSAQQTQAFDDYRGVHLPPPCHAPDRFAAANISGFISRLR